MKTNNKRVRDAHYQELRLIRWMRQDIQKGFGAVVEAYGYQLKRAAEGVLDSTPRLAHLAEDVVQDGLIKAFIELQNKPEKLTRSLKLRAWLYKIVINQALSCLKTGENHLVITAGLLGEELDEEVLEGYIQHYDDPVLLFERLESIHEAKQHVRRAKSILSHNEAAAVDQIFFQPPQPGGKKTTYKQAAEALGKPEGTVKALVSRAKTRMYTYLTTDDKQQDNQKLS